MLLPGAGMEGNCGLPGGPWGPGWETLIQRYASQLPKSQTNSLFPLVFRKFFFPQLLNHVEENVTCGYGGAIYVAPEEADCKPSGLYVEMSLHSTDGLCWGRGACRIRILSDNLPLLHRSSITSPALSHPITINLSFRNSNNTLSGGVSWRCPSSLRTSISLQKISAV